MIDEKVLIERLEEVSSKAEQNMNYYKDLSEEDASCEVFADASEKEYKAFQKSIDIVNQLAEEHNNGFCEWKWKKGHALVQCKGDVVLFENRRIFNFCPYCGNEIKVVEQTEKLSDTWKQNTMSRFERVE